MCVPKNPPNINHSPTSGKHRRRELQSRREMEVGYWSTVKDKEGHLLGIEGAGGRESRRINNETRTAGLPCKAACYLPKLT